jgi:uracil-DNA glycosylase
MYQQAASAWSRKSSSPTKLSKKYIDTNEKWRQNTITIIETDFLEETEMLKNLQKEVKEINDEILIKCKENPELNRLYKGCQIYFSPFVKNPDLMLIGINPGNGYFKHNGEIVQKFEPLIISNEKEMLKEGGKLFEVLYYDIFRKLNLDHIFINSFKTNAYYFATDGGDELKNFLKYLPADLRIEVKQNSIKWLKQIVSIVSPRIILCAGHTAFDYVKNFYGDDMSIIQNKGSIFEARINNTPVIGCERNRANILKKELLIEKLKEYFA